jgi:hypothetical protein
MNSPGWEVVEAGEWRPLSISEGSESSPYPRRRLTDFTKVSKRHGRR